MRDLEAEYRKFPDTTLARFHESQNRAYENDRSLTPEEKEIADRGGLRYSYFGTDIHADWPEHVDALEKVLTEKGIPFSPIKK